MDVESVFLNAIRVVLKNWTALQLAIEEGMGGPYAREKEIWFGQEIEKFFKANDNLQSYEVEDFIAAILDSEFDTIAEDGSLTEVSQKFCKFFELCQAGSEDEVLQFVRHRISPAVNACVALPSEDEHDSTTEIEKNDSRLTSQLQQLAINSGVDEGSSHGTEPLEEEGWTEVKKGRRRR